MFKKKTAMALKLYNSLNMYAMRCLSILLTLFALVFSNAAFAKKEKHIVFTQKNGETQVKADADTNISVYIHNGDGTGPIAFGRPAETIARAQAYVIRQQQLQNLQITGFEVLPLFSNDSFLGSVIRYTEDSSQFYLTPLHVIAGQELSSLRLKDSSSNQLSKVVALALPLDIQAGNRIVWEQNDFALLQVEGQTLGSLSAQNLALERVPYPASIVEFSFPGDVHDPSQVQHHAGAITGTDGGLLRIASSGINPGSSGGAITLIDGSQSGQLYAMSLCLQNVSDRHQRTVRALPLSSIVSHLESMHSPENYIDQIPDNLEISEEYRKRCDPIGEKGAGDGG